MDIEKTKAYYAAYKSEDTERPFEAMLPYEVENEKWEYAGVQYLIAGNADGFEETKIGDVEIFVTPSHPSATYEGEYFVIEISPMRVKCRKDKYQFEEFEDSKGDRSFLTTHISLMERCLQILKNFTVK